MKKATPSVTTLAKPASQPAKKVASPAAKKSPAKAKASKSVAAPVLKTEAVAPSATTIVAQIDIGFGNTLYIRGEGPGLSWEKGVPLDCVADDKWSISLKGATTPIVFKFLVNDLTWSIGEDYIAQPGSSVVLTPGF